MLTAKSDSIFTPKNAFVWFMNILCQNKYCEKMLEKKVIWWWRTPTNCKSCSRYDHGSYRKWLKVNAFRNFVDQCFMLLEILWRKKMIVLVSKLYADFDVSVWARNSFGEWQNYIAVCSSVYYSSICQVWLATCFICSIISFRALCVLY